MKATFVIPPRVFYYVRHGQTDANAQNMMCGGDWDISLNAEGRSQAKVVASKVRALTPKIEKLFVSPMTRTQQTAEIINTALGLEMKTVEGLREWKVGEWEQKPWDDVPNPFNTTVDPPGGESRVEFEARVSSAVTEILNGFSGVPLIVAHGAVAHSLFTVLGSDIFEIENCVVYLIQPEGFKWTLTVVT